MNTRFTLLLFVALGVLLAGTCVGQGAEEKAAKKDSKTLENLMTAYNGESNASERYAAFAKKADEEGYGQVASLFRAASAAEKIHATAQGEVIKKLGGTPKADIKKPEVKSTKENLEASLKGETEELEKMYPEFMKEAREKNEKEAVRVFNFAKSAEADHAKFYKEALANMDSWKTGKKDFYVCATCGRTALEQPKEKCPVCFEPTEVYKKIN